LFRCTVSREALRPTPPTPETEKERIRTYLETRDDDDSGTGGNRNPLFYRPVKPFDWHKVWAGTSWTWGPSSGNRGWAIENIEDSDAWHGSAPVERWNLRLPDGIMIQAPRIVTDAETGMYRVAWLPNNKNLLRLEAGVQALQPMVLEDDDFVGFEPPSLVSLRCDLLENAGDLEGEPQFVKDSLASSRDGTGADSEGIGETSDDVPKAATAPPKEVMAKSEQAQSRATGTDNADDSEPKSIRDALKL